VLGKEHPDTLMSVNNLAISFCQQGKHSEASGHASKEGFKVTPAGSTQYHGSTGIESIDNREYEQRIEVHSTLGLAISFNHVGNDSEI
jgi:hypothetical protein